MLVVLLELYDLNVVNFNILDVVLLLKLFNLNIF